MTNDENSPASKADIRMMMGQMGDCYSKTEVQIADFKEEIVHEFKIITEQLRHDLLGTHKDKIENHEDRLVRLE